MLKFLLILSFIASTAFSAENGEVTKLKAEIKLLPAKVPEGNLEAILPGSAIVVSVKINNVGTKSNEEGYFFVRLKGTTETPNDFYMSEKVVLPPIAPGKEAALIFKTVHRSPSLPLFIKESYINRPYEAIAVIDSKEYVIGSVNLNISAYYFSGTSQQIEIEVPAKTQK